MACGWRKPRRSISKADPVVYGCGTLDEAVAALSIGRATLEDPGLQAIVLELQRGLFAAAVKIAANPRARDRLVPGIASVTAEMTVSLERTIDALLADHPLRPAFVVPGANPSSVALDLARTFLRRAERRLIAARERRMSVSGTLVACANRPSGSGSTCWRGAPQVRPRSRLATTEPRPPSTAQCEAAPVSGRLTCLGNTQPSTRSDREQLGSESA